MILFSIGRDCGHKSDQEKLGDSTRPSTHVYYSPPVEPTAVAMRSSQIKQLKGTSFLPSQFSQIYEDVAVIEDNPGSLSDGYPSDEWDSYGSEGGTCLPEVENKSVSQEDVVISNQQHIECPVEKGNSPASIER